MALVDDAVTTLTFVFRDRGGLSGKTRLIFPAHVPVERIIAQLEPVIILRSVALSDATLTGWSLSRGATKLDPAPPDPNSFVGRKGSFRFRTAGNRSVAKDIPSVRMSLA